ncbi:MAG: SpoIIE family protein phosphatase, partial [Desulfobacterales bacterium]
RSFQFYMANEVLLGNTVILLFGYWMTTFLFANRFGTPPDNVQILLDYFGISYRVISISVLFVLILWYEIPIRHCLKAFNAKAEPDPAILKKARRRVLNEPYWIALIDSLIWLLGTVLFRYLGSTSGILIGIGSGFITVAFVFLWLEHSSQHTRIPLFFPEGDLSRVRGVGSTSIRKRIAALIFAVSLVPLATILMTVYRFRQMRMMDDITLLNLIQHLEKTVITESIVFLADALILSILVIHHLRPPVDELIQAMDHVKKGNYGHKARVYTNDEIGLAAETLNDMSKGLQERERLQNAIFLAQEVQQLLLPKDNPVIPGLDVAGKSIYCEETGGDYYDFLPMGPSGTTKIGVVVGDVSGHGIGSALFMSMARTLLRSRSVQNGRLSQIVNDVNRELANDLEDSGQFMTLFYLVVEQNQPDIRWIRAGHPPAIVYDVDHNAFDELTGAGIPLGVDPDWQYKEELKKDLPRNQIILIGTDGLWEAQNAEGQMFGKEPIYELIRRKAEMRSNQILESIVAELDRFQKGYRLADDVTLVVIKT